MIPQKNLFDFPVQPIAKKPRCYNCKFAGHQFKVGSLTHLHCEDEKQYPLEKWQSGELSPWDSIQVFSDTCKNHEFKTQKQI